MFEFCHAGRSFGPPDDAFQLRYDNEIPHFIKKRQIIKTLLFYQVASVHEYFKINYSVNLVQNLSTEQYFPIPIALISCSASSNSSPCDLFPRNLGGRIPL